MTAWALTDDFSSGQLELLAEGRRLSRTFLRKDTAGLGAPKSKPARKSAGPTEQELLALGTIVGGRYRILGICGQGGMGIVYKARDLVVPRTVALKMLRKDCCTDEQVFRRFQKEAQVVSLLDHPNIVAIHDFGMPSGNQAYLAMDFLEGSSVQRIITEERWIGGDRFQNIFLQACDALAHAHKNGVVHRDVKPSNLLLVERGDNPEFLVIVDFGLVKLMSALDDQRVTTTHTLVGSPLYMSPEQCKHMPIDHRSDIYAMGCTMYEALTGLPPHLGDSPLETFCKHIAEQPPPMRERNPYVYVPPALEQVVLKALAKDPQHRQQSVAELKADIERALAQQDAISVSMRIVKSAVSTTQSIPALVRQTKQKAKTDASKARCKSLFRICCVLLILAALLVATAMLVAASLQQLIGNDAAEHAKPAPPVEAPHIVPQPKPPSQPVLPSQRLRDPDFDNFELAKPAPAKPSNHTKHRTLKPHHRLWTYWYYTPGR